jgi:acyl-CoA synthetase (AMP-forming)/AMP-acid ligase II
VRGTWSTPQAAHYRESGAWAGRLVDQSLYEVAREHPARTAIVDRDRRMSYGELAAAVEQAAAALTALGVGQGDVVAFQLPNWAEATVLYFATVRLGAVANPITPIYRGREVEFILRQARARVLVIPDRFRRFDYRAMVADLRARTPDLEHVLVVGDPGDAGSAFADAIGAAGAAPTVQRDAGDPALLLYTSGTEASPKGVLHSHDTLAYECQSIIDLYELSADDRVFMPSPLTHITGVLYGLILPTMLGTTVALQDVWDAARAVELVARERSTFCVGATPFLHGLVNAADRAASSLRVFACGGADVPPALIRAAHERLGVIASRVYGSTECPTVTASPLRAPLDLHAETDGRPIGATELRVLGEELQVRGPDVCLGYLDPALNERAFTTDGWFRTGDLAVVDPEGSVRIAGRAKDIIVRGGENVSAKEIEDLLFEHPAVEEVAVVGYPDEVLGERACAFVVARAPVTLDDLVGFLRERRVANQKLPERLEVIDALPKTASGKVQKFRLRDQVRNHATSAIEA